MNLLEVAQLPVGTFVRRNQKPKTRLHVGKNEITHAQYSAYFGRYTDGAFMIDDKEDLAATDWEICDATL